MLYFLKKVKFKTYFGSSDMQENIPTYYIRYDLNHKTLIYIHIQNNYKSMIMKMVEITI